MLLILKNQTTSLLLFFKTYDYRQIILNGVSSGQYTICSHMDYVICSHVYTYTGSVYGVFVKMSLL